jgi:hypothetical protein
MNQRKTSYSSKKTKLLIAACVLAIVGIATAATIVLVNNNKTQADSTKTDTPSMQSSFNFNSEKASGWRQGPSNQDSMALFSNDQTCFVSVERKDGTVDPTAATTKTLASLSQDGYTTKALGTSTASIETGSGNTKLIIDQYDVTGSGNAGLLYGGQAYGYAQLNDSYLHAQLNCNSSDQLASAISALDAISFEE